MISITPLGAGPSASSGPSCCPSPKALCHLIRIDSSYLLLDCGAPEDLSFPPTPAAPLRPLLLPSYILPNGDIDTEALANLPLDDAIKIIAPQISLVLLSHSTIRHIGLYAYAKARLGLTCPAFSTLPTAAMGRLVAREALFSLEAELDLEKVEKRLRHPIADGGAGRTGRNAKPLQEMGKELNTIRGRCIPTAGEVDDAFEGIRTLRYLQPTVLEGSLSSISLSAHSAGHTLGGTVWKLRSPTSGTVVLAIDWNHVKERHIDGSGVIEAVSAQSSEAAGTKRAELLVTSGAKLDIVNPRRKDKDKRLLDLVHQTLTISKTTMQLPIDASPRLLEVLLLLDQHWAYSYPHARFPLCLVSRTGKEVLERARTMREWMGKSLQGEEAGRTGNLNGRGNHKDVRDNAHGPLEFRFLRIFTSLRALEDAFDRKTPKIVLTVGPSLLYGPSLKYFQTQIAPEVGNTIVLTQSAECGSVAQQLRRWWTEDQKQSSTVTVGQEVLAKGKEVNVIVRDRIPLQGLELEAYTENQRVKKEREDHHRALLARSRQRMEADQEEESDEEDEDGGDGVEDDSDDDHIKSLPDHAESGLDGGTASARAPRASTKHIGLPDGRPSDPLRSEGDVTLLTSSLSHDIYLRGASAYATNFFNLNHGHADEKVKREALDRHCVGLRYRTAPAIEKRKRIDAFGEVVDVAQWLTRGRKDQEEEERKSRGGDPTASASSGDPKRQRTDGEALRSGNDNIFAADEDDFQDLPTKYTEEETSLAVHCKIVCIDLDGLIDSRALSIVLPQLAPRRLVLVDTPQPMQSALSFSDTGTVDLPITPTLRFIKSLLNVRDFTRDIYTPAVGLKISVGAEVHSFDVKLGEGVFEQLQMSEWEDWGISWLQGHVPGEEQERPQDTPSKALSDFNMVQPSHHKVITVERVVLDSATSAIEPTIADQHYSDPVKVTYFPKSQSRRSGRIGASGTNTVAYQTLFIGDVRLSKLKTLLSTTHRIPSEFGGGGMLVCGSAALAQSSAVANIGALSGTGPVSANQAAAAVTVQKIGEKFILNGNAGRTFVKVRDVVYSMHAQVKNL